MILEVSLDGLWTLSFGLSQCHGHGSLLVCEVAVSTRDCAPVTITIQALSLVEKAEAVVQVRYFTLRLRDQRSMCVNARWMESHVDSYMTSNGSWFKITWIVLKNHLWEVDLIQKPLGEYDISNAHNR